MYILEVKTPGKLLNHRGRTIRTPAKFDITEKEIKNFKMVLRQVGAEDYSIRSKEVDKEKNEYKEISIPEPKEVTHEVIVEEIMDDEEETKSVLDQLIKDSEKE